MTVYATGPRPPDKSVYLKIIFSYFSTKTYVVGTQKNRLTEIYMVLLSTQNTCLNQRLRKKLILRQTFFAYVGL